MNSDVVILCIGEDTYTETPGNIGDMTLSESQLQLADALFDTGKKVIVVFVGGRPRIITSIVNRAHAVLVAFLPGNKGADAIADIIFGDYNPNAKMPISYAKGPNAHITYDHKPLEEFDWSNRYDPIFPFGHGLSYTQFEYSNLKLDKNEIKEPESITGSVTVKNIGNRSGKEVVFVYLNDEYASISRPVRQVKYFTKISLDAGESKTVKFELTRDDMSFIDTNNKRIVESGNFNVYVANLKKSFNLIAKTQPQNSSSNLKNSINLSIAALITLITLFNLF